MNENKVKFRAVYGWLFVLSAAVIITVLNLPGKTTPKEIRQAVVARENDKADCQKLAECMDGVANYHDGESPLVLTNATFWPDNSKSPTEASGDGCEVQLKDYVNWHSSVYIQAAAVKDALSLCQITEAHREAERPPGKNSIATSNDQDWSVTATGICFQSADGTTVQCNPDPASKVPHKKSKAKKEAAGK